MTQRIRVFIVSDIRLYRGGLEEILDSNEFLCVVGAASEVEPAITEINRTSPDIVILDMTMIASCEVVGHIRASCPRQKIVALAVADDEQIILACAKAGISGYVSRDATIQQLINTIRGVSNGELYCPRKIAASLIHKLSSTTDKINEPTKKFDHRRHNSKMSLLTSREQQIASLIFEGFSNKQIANNLSIEISTVKNHVHKIITKFGVCSRTQVAKALYQ